MKLGFSDGALKGRLVAIIVLTVVSGGSFALGYLVGTSAAPQGSPGVVEQPFEEPAAGVEEEFTEVYAEPLAPIALPEVVPQEPEVNEPSNTVAHKEKRRAVKKKPGRSYSVQAGVFEERKYAESFARKLRSKGYSAYIQDSSGGGRTIYKVKVGRFADKEEAAAIVRRLKEAEGIEGFVTGPG